MKKNVLKYSSQNSIKKTILNNFFKKEEEGYYWNEVKRKWIEK